MKVNFEKKLLLISNTKTVSELLERLSVITGYDKNLFQFPKELTDADVSNDDFVVKITIDIKSVFKKFPELETTWRSYFLL